MEEKEVSERKGTVWIIITLTTIPFIMTLGNSMLIPILPMLEKELDITKFQTSLIITMYSVVAIFCIPIAGYLSDRFGRKKVIVPALIITAIGGLVAGLGASVFSKSYIIVLIGRLLQGIGASGAMPIVIPLVGDLFPKDEETSSTLGLIETSNTIGKVLSPIIGTAVALIVWYMPFYLIPALSIISLILIFIFIKEKPKDKENEKFSCYWSMIKSVFKAHWHWLVALFLAGVILMYVLFSFLFYFSNILEDIYDFTGIIKGLLLAIPLLALATASFITGKLIKDNLVAMKWISFSGMLISGLMLIGSIWLDSYIAIIVIFSLAGIGIGIALPALDAMITSSLDKEVRGAVTSIYSAMRFIGVAIGPPVAAALMGNHFNTFIVTIVASCIIGALAVFIGMKPEEDQA